jgi:hypothetical protein
MEPWGSLHTVLTWMPLDGDKDIDWTDTELVKQLWEWHGKKIMDLFRKENRPAERPKIWWAVHYKPEDFKIIDHKDGETIFESESAFLERHNLLEPWEVEELKKYEPWQKREENDSLPFDYSTLEQYYNRIRKARQDQKK